MALSLTASAAYAAVTISYTSTAIHQLHVRPAPVVWIAGPDAAGNPFVADFALSADATAYTIALKGVPKATVTWENLTSLRNQDGLGYHVEVRGASVASHGKVLDFRVEFRVWGSQDLVGTLDLRQPAPEVDLGILDPGAAWSARVVLRLAAGTTAADLPAEATLTVDFR